MSIKEKLALIARISGRTQEKLAAELGVSFPTLNSWINGRSQPRPGAAQRIDELYLRATGQNIIPLTLLEGKKAALQKKQQAQPAVLRVLQERRDLYDQFLLSFTYNTNRLEGSTLTEPETAAILFQNTSLPDHSIIEQMEVKNHQAAFGYMVRHMQAAGGLTEEFVLKLHAMLLNGIQADAGSYRRHAVRIVGSHVPTANYLKVPERMPALLKDAAGKTGDIIAAATRIHSRFEQVHPFSDGNGRVGRLLLAAMLLRNGLPPAIIAQQQKRFYLVYLQQAQLDEDYSRLEDFICDGILTGYALLEGTSTGKAS
jgi:Fic family protein